MLRKITSAATFHWENIPSGISSRLRKTGVKHLIFHVVVLLCFSMSPFDLICSFGLVMAKQLIQQTCLMRCEACSQIQLSYPLPAFLLNSPAYWYRRHSPPQTWGSRGGIPVPNLKPARQTRDQSLIRLEIYLLFNLPFAYVCGHIVSVCMNILVYTKRLLLDGITRGRTQRSTRK